MQTTLMRKLVGASSALAACSLLAVEPGPKPPPVETTQGGLQVTLTTGGYKFVVGDGTPTTAGNVVNSRESFAASAVVYNRSNADIKFTFPSAEAADRRFRFRVFDSAGAQIWVSDADPATAPVVTETLLLRRSAWRRTVQVPLKVAGKPLAAGIYTLEASIEADKQLGGSAFFEVTVVLPDPGPDSATGIKGQVLQSTGIPSAEANPLPSELPLAGVRVVVAEIPTSNALPRPLFFWQGVTDNEGRFQVNTRPGRFRVVATLPAKAGGNNATAIIPSPTVSVKTTEVTVESGKFAEIRLVFPPSQPPPPTDSGIKGLVLIGPIKPVQQDGEPNEAPIAGVQVRVEEIRPANIPYLRPPFTWTGVTNAEGRFEVRTPAGKFRVTARRALIVIDPPPGTIIRASNTALPGSQASAEVVVEQGKFSEITLHLDSGIR